MKEEKAEFYEAQCRSKCDGEWSIWFRLGGRTHAHSMEAIELHKKSRGVTGKFLDIVDEDAEYRIRHFVGTVETEIVK